MCVGKDRGENKRFRYVNECKLVVFIPAGLQQSVKFIKPG